MKKISDKKVFVGLSGGVDSAVSALLLKQAGFDVTGVFIKVWQPDFLPCSWREERRDAMRVAIALDIPFLFFDFSEEYKKGVVDKMIAEYKVGRTPNPDILCNKEVKFGAFWKKAQELGADYIATGHYAQIVQADTARKNALSSRARDVRSTPADVVHDVFSPQYPLVMREGRDEMKDQSYFLWTLTQEDLVHTFFPVGDLEKSEVRAMARKFKLPVSDKKDSQGICFIGEVTMEEFLSHFVSTRKGDVLNTDGEVIGTHKGALLYTIGERKGLSISKKSSLASPFYVVSKDMKTNTLTVSDRIAEITSLSPTKIGVKAVNWIVEPTKAKILTRIRYRGDKLPATLTLSGRKLVVEFDKPARGLSLGQSIVFYSPQGVCLGGAIMDTVIS